MKHNDKTQSLTYLPKEIDRELKQIAEENGLTKSGIIRHFIYQCLKTELREEVLKGKQNGILDKLKDKE